MAQLTCQNLCAGYDGRPVLQDLTFELLAGDYLCIVLVLSTSVVQHTAVLLGNSSTLNKRGGISAKVQPDFACYIQYSRHHDPTHLLYFHSQL